MENYFFLTSSLPALRWGEAPPISSEKLLELAAGNIGGSELETLAKVSAFPPYSGNRRGVAKQYADWDTTLRNALLPKRAAGGEYQQYLRAEADYFSETQGIAQSAAGLGDPLAAEKLLDQARFNAAEALLGGRNFCFDALCAYKIRLELLEKYTPRTTGRGERNLDRILAAFNPENK